MKHLKTFENHKGIPIGWIVPIKDEDLEPAIFKKIPDIRDNVKPGDIVLGVWFSGGFDTFLLQIDDIKVDGLGCGTEDTWYGIESAWGVFDPKDYDKHATKKLDLVISANKYNL